jgi:hypothetical protein
MAALIAVRPGRTATTAVMRRHRADGRPHEAFLHPQHRPAAICLMNKLTLSIAAAAALLFCATPYASEAAKEEAAKKDAKPAETQTAAKDEKPRMICTNERVTGSRHPRRICYTQEQWDDIRKAGSDGLREIQGRPTGIVEEGG